MPDNSPQPESASDDVSLDASTPPDQDAIREAWRETIASRRRREETGEKVFQQMTGTTTPSSVVRSAEGVTQFDGLYQNGNGALSIAARQALRDSIGAIDPSSHEQAQQTPDA
jgi:hypothetical protein